MDEIKVWVVNIRQDRMKNVTSDVYLHEIVFDCRINNREQIGIYRIMSPEEYKSMKLNGYFTINTMQELKDNSQWLRELDDIIAMGK